MIRKQAVSLATVQTSIRVDEGYLQRGVAEAGVWPLLCVNQVLKLSPG